MRAIVINPWLSVVTELNIEDTPESLYRALSWMGSEVNGIKVATPFPNGDNLLVSRLVPEAYPGFLLGSFFCRGNGVILGSETQKWLDAKFLLSDIQDRVRFKNANSDD